MKFLKSLWALVTSFFLDVHNFLDEKRVFGILYLSAALLAPFVVQPAFEALVSLVVVGGSLLLGIPIGSSVPLTREIKSLGILDLVTNYSNRGDPGRLFGGLFLIAALAYVFVPLVLPGLTPNAPTLWTFEGTGLVLLFGAAVFDRPQTEGGV